MKTFPDFDTFTRSVNRRAFLTQSAYGLGGLALASLMGQAPAATDTGTPRGALKTLHYAPKAKRVIHLCMAGGPSHLETFDWKPELRRLHDQPFPESFTKGQQLAQLQGATLKARGPFVDFQKHGKTGIEISSLFPHLAGLADELCVIRSMQTEQINHDTAHAFMNTGSIIKGRPSIGSWLLYGLGAETEDLPGFVVLVSQGKSGAQPVSARQWSSGVLPSKFQGIQFQSKGDPVHYLGSPDGFCQSTQRQVVEEVNRLNGLLAGRQIDPEIQTRISQYEMAFRMQSSVPELTDMSQEPASILEQYGIKQPGDGSFASNCLQARRMAERGVRMIQLYHRAWDHHGGIEDGMRDAAAATDQASAALLSDLKQRGMLDETLVVWMGEFGRTPKINSNTSRDHWPHCYTVLLAGGGVKRGFVYGASDETGSHPADAPVTPDDIAATIYYLMGVDPRSEITDAQGRPIMISSGQPILEVIA